MNDKFNKKNTEALLKLLRKTVPIGIACDKVGIHRSTFYSWKQRAEVYHPADKDTQTYKKYFDFFEKAYQARSEAFEGLLDEIKKMGMGYQAEETVEEYHEKDGKVVGQKKIRKTTKFVRNPASLMFLAERLFPAFFGNRMKLDANELNELILRELATIARLTGRSDGKLLQGNPRKELPPPDGSVARDREPYEPEDWEKLSP
jgi:hypothetical protein